MKILFLTSRLPYPLDKGDKLRAYHQIVQLSKHAEIVLCSVIDNDVKKADVSALLPYVSEFHTIRISNVDRLINATKAFGNGQPFQTAWFYSSDGHDYMQNLVEQTKPDIIFYQLARMASYKLNFPCIHILDYMDAFGIGMERRSKITQNISSQLFRLEAKRMKKYEYNMSKKFDKLFIISEQDAKCIQIPHGKKIDILPNGIDERFFNYQTPTTKEYDLTFVGNMSYLPNIDAAEVLVNHILPLCPANITIEIAGVSPHKRVLSLASSAVSISGYTKDIRDAYARGRIFCAPLWQGTGQQNKILEAMAMGIPCITTPAVNKAIGAKNNDQILEADSIEAFVKCINLLLNDPILYARISKQARIFVQEKFDWEKQVMGVIG